MKYFVTVNVLQSTTKLGRLLSDIVVRRYHNALLWYGEADVIPQFLIDKMEELCTENKRLKPMSVRTSGFNAGELLKGASAQIYVVPDAGAKAWSDNRPFTIQLTPVLKDYTQKGGER